MACLRLIVSAVVELGLLQLAVLLYKVTSIIGFRSRDVLTVGTRTRNNGASKFNTDTTFAGGWVVVMVIKLNEVTDPTGMRVSRDHVVVVNLIVVKCLERSFAIGLVTFPSIVTQRIDVSIGNRFVDMREYSLRANHSSCWLSLSRCDELVVEPLFLAATYHGSSSIVGKCVDVFGVPVQIRQRSIVMTSV